MMQEAFDAGFGLGNNFLVAEVKEGTHAFWQEWGKNIPAQGSK